MGIELLVNLQPEDKTDLLEQIQTMIWNEDVETLESLIEVAYYAILVYNDKNNNQYVQTV